MEKQYLSGTLSRDLAGCLELFQELVSKCPGLPFVSIGSGNGVFEEYLEKNYEVTVFCIDPVSPSGAPSPLWREDPDATEYNPCESGHKPDAKELTSEIIDIYKEKCCVIINWPYYDREGNTDNEYDVNAIEALQPQGVFINYASCGASGSSKMILEIKRTNPDEFICDGKYVNYDVELPESSWFTKASLYKSISCVVKRLGDKTRYRCIIGLLNQDDLTHSHKERTFVGNQECIIS